jgi:tetratricopeptide (TPR) repeat protein
LLGLRLLQDDFDAAVVQLNRAVELVGTNSDAPRLRLAQALVERGRLAEATLPLQALLDLQPDHPAARLEMARLRLGRGELEGLPAWLGPCLTNLHTARAAGLLLSQVRARQGQTELATELARRASALPKPYDWPDPFLREVQALRGDRQFLAEKVQSLAAQRRYEEAETALKELLSRAPEDPESLLLAGRLLLEQRKCPEAEARLREHLRVAPDSLNGLTQLGLALLCQQRWTNAAAVLEQALQRKPDFAQAHANLGLARSRTGDGAGAIRAYEEALRCSPGDPGYHVALAEELLRASRFAEAVSHLERALALDPRNARARALRERMGAR